MPAPLTNLYPGVSVGNAGLGLELPLYDPLRHVLFFDDFYEYVAANWTMTETQAGATQALTSGHGGLLLLTNSAADDDLVSLQYGTTDFAFAATRKAWIETRFQCSEATQVDLFIGLAATDTSPIASAPTDYVAFTKDDGATAINLKTVGSSASIYTASGIGTLAAATDIKLAMSYDGNGNVAVYVNDVKVASQSAAFASLLPSAVLRPTIAIQNGDGNARTLTIDYLLVMMERA